MMDAKTIEQGSRATRGRGLAGSTVVVVGAGMAGLAAARKLHAQGSTVIVLEARNRIGGRVWTERRWENCPLDVGASWINGTIGNPLTRLVQSFRLATVTTGYHSSAVVFTSTGEVVPKAQQAAAEMHFERIMAGLGRKRESLYRDMPLSKAFDHACSEAASSFPALLQPHLKHLFHSIIEQEYAAEGSDLPCGTGTMLANTAAPMSSCPADLAS